MQFPAAHLVKTCSSDPIERLNGQRNRRTGAAGSSSNQDGAIRLVGASSPEPPDA